MTRFMACAYCFAHHQIDADGEWVFVCPEEEQAHQESVERKEVRAMNPDFLISPWNPM